MHGEGSLCLAPKFRATIGLFQIVIGPRHRTGHNLDLVFTSCEERGGLEIKGGEYHSIIMVRPLCEIWTCNDNSPLQGWGTS